MKNKKQIKIPSEQEINIIRGKLLVNKASQEEIFSFLRYVTELEALVEEASMEDFYGTEGWMHRIGWN